MTPKPKRKKRAVLAEGDVRRNTINPLGYVIGDTTYLSFLMSKSPRLPLGRRFRLILEEM